MIYTIDVTRMSNGTYILTDGNNIERSQIVLVFLQNVKDNYGFTVTQRPISTVPISILYTSTTIGGAKIYDNFTSNYDIGFFPMYINNKSSSGSSITIKVDSGKITSANVQGEVYYYSNTEAGVTLQNNNVYYKGINADDSNYNQYTANTVAGSEISDITYTIHS